MRFSVVIPTYNRATELVGALDSLCGQTYRDFEVIVCDDGSTDHTKELIEKFKEQLDLKYFYENNWGGPARPRNIGIQHSNSNWICFLDSDDRWDKQKLEILDKAIRSYNADVYYHFFKFGNTIIGKCRKSPFLTFFEDLLIKGNRIVTSSLCIKKNALLDIGGFSENKDLVEDYDLLLRLAKANFKFRAIKKPLGYYSWGDSNISGNFFKHIKQTQNVLLSFEVSPSMSTKRKALLSYMKGSYLLKIGRYKMARKFLFMAVKNGAFQIRLKSIIKLMFNMKGDVHRI